MYNVDLDNVIESMCGDYGVAFRVPLEKRVRDRRGWTYRKTAWYVAVPGLPHVSGPFGTYKKTVAILATKPDWKARRRYIGLIAPEAS
jgi:hypothetical protein